MIRATETVSRLEARLATVEKDRDEARQQLKELEQQLRAPVSTGMQCCQHCQQREDANIALEGNSFLSVAGKLLRKTIGF